MKNSGMLAAVASAAGLAAAADFTVTAAFVAEHFPDVAATLRKEGADADREANAASLRKEGGDAEHARLAGIDKAALPGHEAIIAIRPIAARRRPTPRWRCSRPNAPAVHWHRTPSTRTK